MAHHHANGNLEVSRFRSGPGVRLGVSVLSYDRATQAVFSTYGGKSECYSTLCSRSNRARVPPANVPNRSAVGQWSCDDFRRPTSSRPNSQTTNYSRVPPSGFSDALEVAANVVLTAEKLNPPRGDARPVFFRASHETNAPNTSVYHRPGYALFEAADSSRWDLQTTNYPRWTGVGKSRQPGKVIEGRDLRPKKWAALTGCRRCSFHGATSPDRRDEVPTERQ